MTDRIRELLTSVELFAEMNDEEIDLSSGFSDLHTAVYRDILADGGFGISDARPAIDLIYQIRNSHTVAPKETAPLTSSSSGGSP